MKVQYKDFLQGYLLVYIPIREGFVTETWLVHSIMDRCLYC